MPVGMPEGLHSFAIDGFLLEQMAKRHVAPVLHVVIGIDW
jgi:hypothetical protein